MITFKNLNIVKNTENQRVDVARQINLTINNASSFALIFQSRNQVQEFTLSLSSYAYLDDYVLAGQYLIDEIDVANPLTLKSRLATEYQVQVIEPSLFDVFNQTKKINYIVRFQLKQRGGSDSEIVDDFLRFVNLDKSILDTRLSEISIFEKIKLQLLVAMLTQVRFIIFEEIEVHLDDAELDEVMNILRGYQVNSGACCLFATTDFSWGLDNCDSIGLIQSGLLLESGSTIEIDRKAFHPLTLAIKQNQFPMSSAPLGCPYATDCRAKVRVSENLCTTTLPVSVSLTDTHMVRCHLSAEERSAYHSEVNNDNR